MRKFSEAAELLLESLSTFTASELMSYEDFVFSSRLCRSADGGLMEDGKVLMYGAIADELKTPLQPRQIDKKDHLDIDVPFFSTLSQKFLEASA